MTFIVTSLIHCGSCDFSRGVSRTFWSWVGMCMYIFTIWQEDRGLDMHKTMAAWTIMSYLTVGTEPVGALVVLHQVSDTGEPRICIGSVQCPRVLSQNLTEQTDDQGEVDHWHLDQSSGWPHTFKRLRMSTYCIIHKIPAYICQQTVYILGSKTGRREGVGGPEIISI